MNYDATVEKYQPTHRREHRKSSVAIAWAMGIIMGIGILAIWEKSWEELKNNVAVQQQFLADEMICRERLNAWLYGGGWVQRREPEQWRHFKTHMGECIRVSGKEVS